MDPSLRQCHSVSEPLAILLVSSTLENEHMGATGNGHTYVHTVCM